LGVLQTLVMQNSPHRHSESLYGQYIFPQGVPFAAALDAPVIRFQKRLKMSVFIFKTAVQPDNGITTDGLLK
jgi:hypothetical protein